jgi:hypothetical protein
VNTRYVAAILVMGFAVLMLNLTGFCYLECRYVPKRELFERAIAYRATKIGDYSPNDTPSACLERHPNCCSIPVFQPENSILNILLGYRIKYVRVVHRRLQEEIDRSPRAGEFYEAFVEVAPCGTPLRATGTTLTEMN